MVSLINSKLVVPILARKNKEPKPVFFPSTDDMQKFHELYQLQHRQIFNLCFRVTKNKDVAEDLTVKVFVEFYKELKGSDTEAEAAALRRVAVTNLLNHFHVSAQV